MKTLGTFFSLLIGFIILFNADILAGNHTVSATVEITSTAINRYLNTQYNATGFLKTLNVTYGGTNYTIALTLPQVILTPGNAKLRMIFDVNSPTTNVYHFEADPSINIPTGQINGAQIQAFLTDLPTQLSYLTFLPSWVTSAIIQAYNTSFGFNIYPTKLIDQVNTTWFADRSINLISPYFQLNWQVVQDAIDFTVSTYLDAQTPKFWVALLNNGADEIFIESNIQVTIREVIVSDGTSALYDVLPQQVICPKDGTVMIKLGNSGTFSTGGSFYVKTIYTTNNTWYCAEYNAYANINNPDGTQVFFGPKNKINF